MKWEDIIPFVLTGTLSFCLFYFGISQWLKRKSCKERITGMCLKKRERQPSVNKVYYCEVNFEYIYNGKKYTSYAIEQFKSKKHERFQTGSTYPLYVNPNIPENIRCTDQLVTTTEIFSIVFGGFFLLAFTGMVMEQILNWIK